MFSSRKKKHSPLNSAPANRLASQPLQSRFPTTESQSQSRSQLPPSQQTQQSQYVRSHWSTHTPPSGHSPSPFPRYGHALSTNATAAGELFLFGGIAQGRICNDLYVVSTRDFSITLLKTTAHVPRRRRGDRAVLTSTTLLIWSETMRFTSQRDEDHSFYLLDLVSREWTRIVVGGPGPGRRSYHTMTLVGSKLFVFGGWSWQGSKRYFNDIWALDLNCLESNPFWESYEPAHGDEKPLPRDGHVSVTIGDRIIIFGGSGGLQSFNDTWSFNISTRKWTELQCTGSIPSIRTGHNAVLIEDVMYVFGGLAPNKTILGDLSALNLSTQRWSTFEGIGPSPCRRYGHAMASDGRSVFVLGGILSLGAQVDEAKLIHVLDTKDLKHPDPYFDTVNPSEKTTQLVRNSSESASLPTRGQPHQPSSSSSVAHAAPGASPFQKKIPEEQDHHAKFVAPDAPSGKEIARLGDRLVELERQLSETLVVKAERDQHIAQLTDDLALKGALLEQAEANAAKVEKSEKRAGLELRKLQVKLDELLLSRDHALEQAQNALQKASCATEANEKSQRELTEMRAELEASKSESAAFRLRLADTENSYSKSKAEVDTNHTPTATGLANTDEDRVVHSLMERVQAMEAEMASLRGNEKSFERMECRNED